MAPARPARRDAPLATTASVRPARPAVRFSMVPASSTVNSPALIPSAQRPARPRVVPLATVLAATPVRVHPAHTVSVLMPATDSVVTAARPVRPASAASAGDPASDQLPATGRVSVTGAFSRPDCHQPWTEAPAAWFVGAIVSRGGTMLRRITAFKTPRCGGAA
jgi:hypothetical protein